jgi:hypothetical protein
MNLLMFNSDQLQLSRLLVKVFCRKYREQKKFYWCLDVSPSILNVIKQIISGSEWCFEIWQDECFIFDLMIKNNYLKRNAKVDLIRRTKNTNNWWNLAQAREGASVSFVGTDEHTNEEFVFLLIKYFRSAFRKIWTHQCDDNDECITI